MKRSGKSPAKFRFVYREPPVKFLRAFRGISVKGKKRKKAVKKPKKSLDKISKTKRGRPPKSALNLVTGHAYNFRIQLGQVWGNLEGPLLASRTEEEVKAAFEKHAQPYARDYVPALISDIVALIRDPKFPKRPEARVNFLANSLGGRPELSFRTSRDICERELARQRRKSPHHIIRKEYYVECSCGYKGPALDHACRKCGAGISFSLAELMGPRLF